MSLYTSAATASSTKSNQSQIVNEKNSNELVLLSPYLAQEENGADKWLWHWCVPCDELHRFKIEGANKTHEWDSNLTDPYLDKETNNVGGKKSRCHYMLHFGRIQYCSDSAHELAGQMTQIPLIPEEATSSVTGSTM